MKLLTVITLGVLPLVVNAQNYSVHWHKITGGGGISSGGQFSVLGSIGQPDAGKASGGAYVLEGGFLSGINVVQTPGAPRLSIEVSGLIATISWAAQGSDGFVLEETGDLNSPASWAASSATVETGNTFKQITIPADGTRFYRLRKP